MLKLFKTLRLLAALLLLAAFSLLILWMNAMLCAGLC